MTNTNKQVALAIIAGKIAQVDELLAECAIVAKEAEVDFSWDGPEYGMGGYYKGKLQEWVSSSQNC
jgi:hypothetical protein